MFAYLEAEIGDAVRPETLHRFVTGSAEMIDWLSDYGVPFDASLCPYKTSYPNNRFYLYFSGSENSGRFRTVTPPKPRGHRAHGRGASGRKIYRPLAAAAARGVDFMPHARALSLITDSNGGVAGVRVSTLAEAPPHVRRRYRLYAALAAKPGVYYPPLRTLMDAALRRIHRRYARLVDIHARTAVILCAGGYIAHRGWISEHAPEYSDGLQLGTSGDDGSGIQLGLDVGAATTHLDNVSAWVFITPPSAFLGALIVNDDGERFIDETRYGAAIGHAVVKEHAGRAWIFADHQLLQRARAQLSDQAIWFQRLQMEAKLRTDRVHGHTPAEAAAHAGVNPSGLLRTITDHNEAAAAGGPDPMGKAAEFVEPIGDGPYSLISIGIKRSLINPCPTLTLGGW